MNNKVSFENRYGAQDITSHLVSNENPPSKVNVELIPNELDLYRYLAEKINDFLTSNLRPPTNGDMIKILFPDALIPEPNVDDPFVSFWYTKEEDGRYVNFRKFWWDEPYKGNIKD